MNKFIKISISFIIFGLVLIGLATYLNNGHIPRFSSNSEKKNYTVSVNDVKNLDLDIIDSDVTIEENTASKNMEIEYYTALERKVNIEHIGNKLSIKENKNIVSINFNFFTEKRKLIIKIPKSSNIDINLVNKIGDYFIKNLDIKSLIINSELGDVYITNISASDADIKLATGNLNIDNLNSKNNSLKINVATGNVKLNNINDLKDISIDNKTGDTDLSSSTIKDINITNKLGNIKVSNLPSESSDNINLKTTTGNITLSNLTANNSITLKSTEGNIIAELSDEESNFTNSSNKKKQLFTSSNTGTVNVKFSNK